MSNDFPDAAAHLGTTLGEPLFQKNFSFNYTLTAGIAAGEDLHSDLKGGD